MSVYKDAKRNTWLVKLSYLNWKNERKWLTKRGFETKHEASAWEAEFLLKSAGKPDMTLNSFCPLYMSNIKNRIKPDTYEMKQSIIDKWILPILGEKAINSITKADILQWQNYLLKYEKGNGKGFTKSYLKTIHNQLSAILNHAIRYYNLTSNPAAIIGNMGNDKEVHVDYWTKEEYLKFADAVMDEPMYYYLFEVLYFCGLREGEAFALTPEDINFDEKTISVSKTYYVLKGKEYITSPKTRKSIRTITVPDFLCEELKDYMKMIYQPGKGERLFPTSKAALHRAMERGSKKAGVKQIRIHDLRHSHVSLLIDMGLSAVAIGERVGHESVYITYHYAHLFPSVQKNIASQLNAIREPEEEKKNECKGQ